MSEQTTKPLSTRDLRDIQWDASMALERAAQAIVGHLMRIGRRTHKASIEERASENICAADAEFRKQMLEDADLMEEYDTHHYKVLQEDHKYVRERYLMRKRESERLAKLARQEGPDSSRNMDYLDSDEEEMEYERDYDDDEDEDYDEDQGDNEDEDKNEDEDDSDDSDEEDDSEDDEELEEDEVAMLQEDLMDQDDDDDDDDDSQLQSATYLAATMRL